MAKMNSSEVLEGGVDDYSKIVEGGVDTVLEYLQSKDRKVDDVDAFGDTLLHWAIRLLIKSNKMALDLDTPEDGAEESEELKTALLLASRSNVTIRNTANRCACDLILNAFQVGMMDRRTAEVMYLKIMRPLLPKALLDTKRHGSKMTRFNELLYGKYYRIAREVLDCAPHLGDSGIGQDTPAMVSAKSQDMPEDLMQRLIDPQFVNIQNYEGQTALHIAVKIQNTKAMKHLLAADCRVDIADSKGKLPIHLYFDNADRYISINGHFIKALAPLNGSVGFEFFIGSIVPWLLYIQYTNYYNKVSISEILNTLLFGMKCPSWFKISFEYTNGCCSQRGDGCIAIHVQKDSQSSPRPLCQHLSLCQVEVVSSILIACGARIANVPSPVCQEAYQDVHAQHISAIDQIWNRYQPEPKEKVPILSSKCADLISARVSALTIDTLRHQRILPPLLVNYIANRDVAAEICSKIQKYGEHKATCQCGRTTFGGSCVETRRPNVQIKSASQPCFTLDDLLL